MTDEQPTAESIPHSVIVRAPGLLPMLYKVRELAQELETSRRTIRRWARRGMPHERDGRNHIWINGEEFAQWCNRPDSLTVT
jgi:excisionase family DNA binding protein